MKLPSLLPEIDQPIGTLTPTGERDRPALAVEIAAQQKANESGNVAGTAQARLFLRRLNGIKDKMEKDMEYLRISRESSSKAPKGGKQLMKDVRRRSEE